MKNIKAPRVVVAAIIKKNNKYLLIKEKLASGEDKWIIPGGGVEYGETLEQAVIREIKEELNLNIKVIKQVNFKESVFPQFNYHSIIFFFLAVPKNDDIKSEDIIIDYKYFSKDEIKNLSLVDSAKSIFEDLRIINK